MAWTTPGTATAGEVLTASFWNEQVRDNTDALYQSIKRFGYQTKSGSNYDITQSSLASAADIFASDITWTADGVSAYIVEFFAPVVYTGDTTGAQVRVHLVNGTGTDIKLIAQVGQGNSTNSSRAVSPVFARYFYTPTAGSVSINARAIWVLSVTGGAAIQLDGVQAPAYLAVYGPSIT